MRRSFTAVVFAALITSLAGDALSIPEQGRAVPRFEVDDLAGTRRSERDLRGRWTVAVAISDKDAGDRMRAWWRLLDARLPPVVQRVSLISLDIFGIVPTATILGRARDETPRARWGEVWLARDGSLAEQLGLPESETPWVFVIAPDGRVSATVHGLADDDLAARVLRSLPSDG